MNVFQITGGRELHGAVDVPGSKNAALGLLSAVALCKGTTVLHNIPQISDTVAKAALLEQFGAHVEWRNGSLHIDASYLEPALAKEETVRSIRTSFFLLGPLLARLGHVKLAAPGGCKIGARPLDFHLKGLRLMGAEVEFEGGVYHAKADRLRGAEIYFDFPSAGATQHLMTTAVLAEGSTVIQNAAMEPEVCSLAAFLNRMGGRIEGAGTSTITIEGVSDVHSCEFNVPPDRMQAGTYMLAGAITRGDITVRGILPEDQAAVISKLREAGAMVDEGPDWVRVRSDRRLKGVKVKTMPYPGFATDMQQPVSALLALAEGTSIVEETIYEARVGHIQELNRMGADIRLEGRTSIIAGVEKLRGAVVEASDLRAGASLILAALAAEGETTVKNIQFVDRGYEDLEGTIQRLGGRIERVSQDAESFLKTSETAN